MVSRIFLFLLCGCLLHGGSFKEPKKHGWWEPSVQAHEKGKDRLSKGSLLHYRKWIYSQFGEDGIIEEIFSRLGIKKGYAVEFGAWDGVYLSNTYNLFKQGWEGHLIEGSAQRLKQAEQNFPDNKMVTSSVDYVIDEKNASFGRIFDEIADEYIGSREIDFLSIDIDGLDYYILKSLQRRPKVICIECNRGWHPLFDKEIPKKIAAKNMHQPLALYIALAKKMGYTPVTFNIINLFLVRDEFAYLFKECKNDCLTLWRDSFRVAPKKGNFRKNRFIFQNYEDKNYDQEMPITLDF